ncbi:ribonuclease HI [Nannocystis pusilla]|uniref:Ribonuclease H n=1 Tax=Nannocystis pusilla TaxID=889268 RepID=A0ABS7TN20_9BACT|nr:ribonuclease HI [Nannocystis pusilla]MBZ5709619.1 ribonuclease HI [Nannocystis pusilla]
MHVDEVNTGRSQVELFTDGACSGNPGPGGWAYILRHSRTGTEIEASGGEAATTNQRMELTAALKGLEALKLPCAVTLYSDSQYVTKGITEWLPNWQANGWRSANRKPVKNQDLWMSVAGMLARHIVKPVWVRGHSGHPENERCDKLAVAAARKFAL